MVRKILFLVLITIGFAFAPHDYFVSVTEAEYNEDAQSFQLTMKFIGHDLEKAIVKAGAPDLHLGTKEELPETDKYILDYINKSFHFKVDDKELVFTMVGKEISNDDFLYCYIESEKVRKIKKVDIENSMLTEVFDAQENIVHLTIKGKKESYSFNKEKRKSTLSLD